MSDVCPNCGSPVDRSSAYQRTTHTTKFICGGLLLHTGGEAKLIETEACDLIRSLREELAEAEAGEAQSELDLLQVIIGRDEALSLVSNLRADLIEARDAERDQIADWHENEYEELARDSQCIEHDTGAHCDGCSGCLNHARAMSHLQAAQSLRGNEHRSNG